MNRRRRQIVARVLALTLIASTHAIAAPEGRADAPAGQMTWALHFTLAPTLFEPAETPGLITPFMMLYALHDALVKPLPERGMASSLAESWRTSHDGLIYELVRRTGATIPNGVPATAEDGQFCSAPTRGLA